MAQEQIEIKPCPFCGSVHTGLQTKIIGEMSTLATTSFANCQNCGAKGPEVSATSHKDMMRAIELWNKARR